MSPTKAADMAQQRQQDQQPAQEDILPQYRSDSLMLLLFGSMASGSRNHAVIVDSKACADIRAIALAGDGEYLPEMSTLLMPKKVYEFSADMVTDNEKKVSIDALSALGWSKHHDPVRNAVFIEK